MAIVYLSFLNAVIFAIYCIIVSYIILPNKKTTIKKIIKALIPFLIMYYAILCLMDSIYAIFFSGICAFIFIKVIFEENIFMSMFISLVIHTIKISVKIIVLSIIGNESLMLVNTYKTLDWNAFYMNLITLIIATIAILLLRKLLRKIVQYVTSLKNRKLVLFVAVYFNFILILLYQPLPNFFSLDTITAFIMIFTVVYIGIFNISSEMKMESLTKYYNEIFDYSKANDELLNHYKMQVHENKNRLLMIRGMIDGPKKDTKKYIEGLLKEINSNKCINNYWLAELKYIPIPGVRNFINYKLTKMTNLGAEIEVFVSSELENIDASFISDTEYNQLTTILGVILDNMIEAIEEVDERLISINIYIENDKICGDYVNSFSGNIDLDRLNEVGYTTKGEQHGMGLPLVAKITKQNKRFECTPEIIDNFFIQHFNIKIYEKDNLQKTTKK